MGSKGFIIVFLLVSQALDLITTYVGLGAGLSEGNPIPSMFLSAGGHLGLLLFKLTAVAVLLGIALLLQSRYPRLWHGVTIAAVITMGVVASNAVTIAMAMI